MLEHLERGSGDLEAFELAEQGLEREHLALRDAGAEQVAQLGPDAGVVGACLEHGRSRSERHHQRLAGEQLQRGTLAGCDDRHHLGRLGSDDLRPHRAGGDPECHDERRVGRDFAVGHAGERVVVGADRAEELTCRGRGRVVGDDDRRSRRVDLVEHLGQGIDGRAANAQEAHIRHAIGRSRGLGRDQVVDDPACLVKVTLEERLYRRGGLECGEQTGGRLGNLGEDGREVGVVGVEFVGSGEEDRTDLIELECR